MLFTLKQCCRKTMKYMHSNRHFLRDLYVDFSSRFSCQLPVRTTVMQTASLWPFWVMAKRVWSMPPTGSSRLRPSPRCSKGTLAPAWQGSRSSSLFRSVGQHPPCCNWLWFYALGTSEITPIDSWQCLVKLVLLWWCFIRIKLLPVRWANIAIKRHLFPPVSRLELLPF